MSWNEGLEAANSEFVGVLHWNSCPKSGEKFLAQNSAVCFSWFRRLFLWPQVFSSFLPQNRRLFTDISDVCFLCKMFSSLNFQTSVWYPSDVWICLSLFLTFFPSCEHSVFDRTLYRSLLSFCELLHSSFGDRASLISRFSSDNLF